MEYQESIHRMVYSRNNIDQKNALDILVNNFKIFPDKQKAWDDLYKFIFEDDTHFSNYAMKGLSEAIKLIPNNLKCNNDILKTIGVREDDFNFKTHKVNAFKYIFDYLNEDNKLTVLEYILKWKHSSYTYNECAVDALNKNINDIPPSIEVFDCCFKFDQLGFYREIILRNDLSKNQHDCICLWNYFIDIILNKNLDKHYYTDIIELLSVLYNYLHDKEKVWNDISKLIDKSISEIQILQILIDNFLIENFRFVENKEFVWKLIIDNYKDKKYDLFERLEKIRPLMVNKEDAYNDISSIFADYGLPKDSILESIYSWVPNKEKAWDDIYKVILKHKYYYESVECIYPWVPNKEKAWDDLYKLVLTMEPEDRSEKLKTLKNICYLNVNKNQVWNDIFELSKVEKTIIEEWHNYDCYDGTSVSETEVILDLVEQLSDFLKYICEQTPDKEKIWKDVCNSYEEKEYNGLYILTSLIDFIENKIMMWDDIIKISLLEYNDKLACVQLLDLIKNLNAKIKNKDKVWNDLCRLLKKNNDIRKQISEIMSSTFRYVSDKDKAWNDLYQLAKNDNREIRDLSVDIMDSIVCFVPKSSVNHAIGDLKELKYNIKDNPHIININISKTDIDFVRIAAVQINFVLNDDFPFKIKNDYENIKNKIISAIKKAKSRDAHIICLPELSLCEEWLSEIKNIGKGSIIIPGSFYNENNQNVCPIVMDNNKDVPPHIKIAPSDDEMDIIAGEGMIPGDTIHIYNTSYGRFAILICRDFLQNFTKSLDVDMIFVISYNDNIPRYKNYASDFVITNPSFIIISNVSRFGGTSIFGQLHKKYYSRLEKKGYRDEGDDSSVICRLKAGDEKIIIADLNLNLKTISQVNSNIPDKKHRSIGIIEILDLF